MEHGNKKYDFEPLKEIGGEVIVKPANLYSLKSALRQVFKIGVKSFKFDDAEAGQYKVTRIA